MCDPLKLNIYENALAIYQLHDNYKEYIEAYKLTESDARSAERLYTKRLSEAANSTGEKQTKKIQEANTFKTIKTKYENILPSIKKECEEEATRMKTLATKLGICTDISGTKNKKFISKYCTSNLILPTVEKSHDNNIMGKFNDNILFMRSLDMLLYYSKSFNELKTCYYNNRFRSTHLYKGIKSILIQDYLNENNIIKTKELICS